MPGPHRRRTIRTDVEILSDVADALSGDSRIDASEIDLEVTYGVVKLMGTVPAFEQGQLAEEDAQGVSGVAAVRNDLTVPPCSPHPPYDLSKLWPE
jgi:osmotically-inducible protein OsmY